MEARDDGEQSRGLGARPGRPPASWTQALLIVFVVLLLRLPFLNQAIQGDDVYYLAGAQHAQIDPAHPNHARYMFEGRMVDMRGHPHPPLNAWVLAALLAALGDISEPPFHAAYIAFSIAAALAMWALARRFTPRPLAATMLFLATPAFVVNGNSLESDIPLLAFWMGAAALYVRAVDFRSPGALAGAAACLALASLAAYQAVVLMPILALYVWLHAGRWRPGWIALAAPALTLALWQIYERASTGELPATLLAGYFQSYGLQTLANKVRNAAALTAHLGWLLCPPLAAAAFRDLRVAALALPLAFLDPHPLFWASGAIGLMIIAWCVKAVREPRDPDRLFLAAWVLVFFAAALALFFAGSARYLLPLAAPVALLGARRFSHRPRWLAAGFALQLGFSVSLAVLNYQHWDAYRDFVRSLREELQSRRVWINAELGLRYYAEAEGGLPMERGQAVRPGDVVLSSELAFPIAFTTGGGALTPLAEREVRPGLPFRLLALGSKSGYSSAAFGFRPFDLAVGPIDKLHAQAVVERKPSLSYLPMNAPEAESQIVSGVYQLEPGGWRWMGGRAALLLKAPAGPAPFQVSFYIPPQASARRVQLSIDGVPVASASYGEGAHTLVSAPVRLQGDTATAVIAVDKTFSTPGDHRALGMVLTAAGFPR